MDPSPGPSDEGRPRRPDLKALRERLRRKGDQRRGDNQRPQETGGSGGGP